MAVTTVAVGPASGGTARDDEFLDAAWALPEPARSGRDARPRATRPGHARTPTPPARRMRLGDLSAGQLLDALPDPAVVLDDAGVIVAVNHAWRSTLGADAATPPDAGLGLPYLALCAERAPACCPDPSTVAEALAAVLAGRTREAVQEFGRPAGDSQRWFLLRVTPMGAGALVTHVNISRQKDAERTLRRRADEDPLTGLTNRTALLETLRLALAAQPGRARTPDVGVAYLDLDGFKPVNDRHGHAMGDLVLQVVADRLRALTRPGDTVARIGGDEFVIVAPRITPSGLAGLRRRIGSVLSTPISLPGDHGCVQVGVSVGAVLVGVADDPELALHRADEAMYAAKRARQAQRTVQPPSTTSTCPVTSDAAGETR